MERSLNSIGILDNSEGREYMTQQINDAFNNINSGIKQANGRISVETLASGPNGLLKMQTIWEGNKLITINLFGSN